MAYEAAEKQLKKYGLDDRIKLFDVSSATVELAAKALGCEPERIAKSIALADGENALMIIAAGDAKIDNHKFKQTFSMKAKMLSFDDTERLTGHAVGGVCPFGVSENVRVYLDESLKRFDIVYPAAGTANSAVKLTVDELFKASEALSFVDVCKLPEGVE